jgi:carbonic anhydrase
MRTLGHLFERNRQWAERLREADPGFFPALAREQTPGYLWIGCSDSRVPANQIVDVPPGEVFVHRNVANVVVHTDLDCLSAIQFAVDALQVRDIIVCGHYGCGGVQAAFRDQRFGLIDYWLRHVQDVERRHAAAPAALAGEPAKLERLCELNVIEQVANVCRTSIVRDAWRRGQPLAVHGWIYRIDSGLLRDLGLCVEHEAELPEAYAAAVAPAGPP